MDGKHYREMTERADSLVANTIEMAAAIKVATNREATVIGDPYEGPKGEPEWKWQPGRRIEALWFGHPSNLDTIKALLQQLATRKMDVALSIRICTLAGCIAGALRIGWLILCCNVYGSMNAWIPYAQGDHAFAATIAVNSPGPFSTINKVNRSQSNGSQNGNGC